MPKFSIVITTTRPRLVPSAIRSAIAQDFSDFEVIVSDNSDKGCKEIVDEFADTRFRYVRPSNFMNVTEHWNFAFSHAVGDWQLLLCDDDAIVSSTLSILAREIGRDEELDSISWSYAALSNKKSFSGDQRQEFTIPAISKRHEVFSSQDLIEKMFDSGTVFIRELKPAIPFMPRAAYSRKAIEKAREGFGGQLFLSPDVMSSGALGILAHSTKTLALKTPLQILGSSEDLIEKMFDSGTVFIRELKPAIPFMPRAAYSRKAIEKAREGFGGQLFLSPDVMSSGALGILAHSTKTLALKTPLQILGSSEDSNGAHLANAETFEKAIVRMSLDFVPIRSWHLLQNVVADTLLRCQKLLPDKLSPYQFNWERYFAHCWEEIETYRGLGYELSAEIAEFNQALDTFPADFRQRLQVRLKQTKRARSVGNRIAEKARTAPIRLARALGYKPFSVGRALDPRKIGCLDIFDCAQYLGKIIQRHS